MKLSTEKRLDMSLVILTQYSRLLDSYILDFFIDKHFQNLPRSWQNHFKHISIVELSSFINFQNSEFRGVWPLSLLVLRFLLKILCLPRTPQHCDLEFKKNIGNKNELRFFQRKVEDTYKYLNISANGCSLSKCPELQALLIKHVKSKKRYEIMAMAETTAEIALQLGIDHIVDIGSGLGHLSRIFGYGIGLNVLSIESQELLSKEAEKLDEEFEISASKYLGINEIETMKQHRPIRIQKTINHEITSSKFLDLVRKSFNNEEGHVSHFGIIGLHPCGNLASKLLNLFVNCPEAKFINIAGCCYHKVTVLGERNTDPSFLVSNFCREKYINLSHEARALACHALESYCTRLSQNDYDHLKIHCYRATLEYIINKNWPNIRRHPLNNVRHGPTLTFKLYCEKAIGKIPIFISDEDLESEEISQYLSEWKNVVIYYSLRLMLAPLVETVILLDRMLYVTEKGFECALKTLFQPEISPRNFVLMARKRKQELPQKSRK